jgi:hypothetical protein
MLSYQECKCPQVLDCRIEIFQFAAADQVKRKEDLGMNGNQLNYAVTTWTVGYLIGEIPSNILLTRIRPSIWLPACEVRGPFSHFSVVIILTSSDCLVGTYYAIVSLQQCISGICLEILHW